jgi:hypothetical protein
MSEPIAIYELPTAVTTPAPNPPRLTPEQVQYYEEVRRAYITKLRALDRLLGRPQTIPERERAR